MPIVLHGYGFNFFSKFTGPNSHGMIDASLPIVQLKEHIALFFNFYYFLLKENVC